ncbi:MAG: DsbA family oxidoreductase [Gammaproteobacteria bacterium]|nr:DsbA family oxidoreductase [Rhodocyclaceae bacterium]MBU3908593.1 DsbA family oxidoreductase [Gammaproteobacteria bacterium]MBU3990460.1 DsbA family oxidoreductase [Gammaproteobacteria bacterium]MBU4004621.1 DsbA family oxidoreductase [Gammaproteobacteria bacterium]MBU4021224.1 DsbA family oxidoreductase [Gammaproteobacteria bacterium]
MLTIEIVSDVVCPWCFIGKRRLETALAMVRRDIPDFACQTIWRPFFLNPDTPPEGEPYLPFLVNKFGSREKVEELFERVREAGRAYGLDYAFEKIALRANTLKAHRLLHWAQAKGNADALIERLFAAQFQRGEAVGDPETLVKIAAECGYDAKEVAAYLASDRDVDLVRQRESAARQMGITMIPTFILAGKQIIVGAEDPAILAEGIRRSI